jgi:PBSX family phage terminase large subunit
MELFSEKQKVSTNDFIKSDDFFTLWVGAIRSGKSYSAIIAFLIYTQNKPKEMLHIISGKNLRAMENQLITEMTNMCKTLGVKVNYNTNKGLLTINGIRYMVVAANDETSYKRIQSITAHSAMLDEIQLMPENYITQVISRLTYKDSKLIGSCNPESPLHYLKLKYIDTGRIDKVVNFNLNDNPTLAEETKARYEKLFTGVFYDRNILGKWVKAEGLIYLEYYLTKEFDIDEVVKSDIGVDYGIAGITAYEKLDYYNSGSCVVSDSYRYDGADGIKTDGELVDDLIEFIGKSDIDTVWVDPSALSFIAECNKRYVNYRFVSADNEVLPGIKVCMNGFISKELMVLDTNNNLNLINELNTYSWDIKIMDKPVKKDDHHCDALRYGYYSRNKLERIGIIPIPSSLT